MRPNILILLPLALLTACAMPAMPTSPISPWSSIYGVARDERSPADILFDNAISTKIKAELLQKNGELGLKVKVYCFLQGVTLLGQLSDEEFKAFAVATAWEAQGVRAVSTHWVAPYGRNTTVEDMQVAAELRLALVADKDLSATQIEMEVFTGHVFLLGLVRSRQDVERAVAHAQAVKGASEVHSLLIERWGEATPR